MCGLSLLLVLSLAPRGFSTGTPVSPSLYKKLINISKFQFDLERADTLCSVTKQMKNLFTITMNNTRLDKDAVNDFERSVPSGK